MGKNKSARPRKKDGQAKSLPADDDPKFRLRPPSARAAAQGDMGWSIALRTVFRYAKTSAKFRNGSRGESSRIGLRRSFNQRCAVRVTYSPNKTVGQWRAHGIYIARESASGKGGNAGFQAEKSETDVASRLDTWQNQRDERIWKVILSPEFGDRIDLEQMTREVMKRSERQLGTALEWVAVTHFNTEHPHVHLVIRGRRDDGTPLSLPREFIKEGLRSLAADACTLQLGPRTELDAAVGQEREVRARRYTFLDRALERRADPDPGDESNQIRVMLNLSGNSGNYAAASREQHLQARLIVLQNMGLARQQSQQEWLVHIDFSAVLRAMQLASDRQKILAANGSLLSDQRMSLNVLDLRRTPEVQGRVIVHGEEEQGSGMGRHYLLLEGTDAQIHMVFYTPEMEIARSAGRLNPNSFVRFRQQRATERSTLQVEDLGNAEALLKNSAFVRSTAQRLIRRGVFPTEEGWGGWLGKYQAAVRNAALTLQLDRNTSRAR
jgi:type IV secretory pathway VirD2 relaxase